MRYVLLLAGTALLVCAPGTARGEEGLFRRFEVGAGLDAGGPLLFRDTPDAQIESPTVFEYGTRLGFRFGTPGHDPNRFGVVVGWHALARSGSRKLASLDPMAVYAAGGDTEMQLGLGARVAIADEGFRLSDGRVPFTGPLASLELRHAFVDDEAATPIGIVLGAFAEAVLGSPTTYSTAFVGARIDLTYRKN